MSPTRTSVAKQSRSKSQSKSRVPDLVDASARIDPADPTWWGLLKDLQGNILKGHDRDYATHIFLKFNTDDPNTADVNRRLIKFTISKLAPRITSARQQLLESELYKRYKIRGTRFVSFFLTHSGYRALREELPTDPAFRGGMEVAAERLNDPPSWTWEFGGSANPIDAMILIADDDRDELARSEMVVLTDVIRAKDSGHEVQLAEVVHVERGRVFRNSNGEPVEHFGYLDGISNPLFLTTDQDRVNYYRGETNWKPWAPPDLVLHRDRGGHEADSYGSYVVFRKLEQNVKRFTMQRWMLAQKLYPQLDWSRGFDDTTEKQAAIHKAGALMVGRYEDGTPLMEDPTGTHSYPLVSNNFNYDEDKQGRICPFHAHIRNVNQRGSQGNAEPEKRHRIVRRGITYGERAENFGEPLHGLPDQGVGLLFMCYQSDIGNQYEHLQRIMNGGEPTRSVDTIGGSIPDEQRQPTEYRKDNGEVVTETLDAVVKMKGGEYFFAPSISFLEHLFGRAKQGSTRNRKAKKP